jgi:hypothetical protein
MLNTIYGWQCVYINFSQAVTAKADRLHSEVVLKRIQMAV